MSFQKGHKTFISKETYKEIGKKVSKARKGIKFTKIHIENMRKATQKRYNNGWIAPMTGEKLSEHMSKEINNVRKQNISKTFKRLYKEGKRKTILVGNKWKKIKYKGYQMRSSWEVVFAKWLNKNKLEWKYEPKIFQCKTIKYIPDFYVKDLDSYVEIKGYMYPIGQKKINEFKKSYPNLNFILITNIEPYTLEGVKR